MASINVNVFSVIIVVFCLTLSNCEEDNPCDNHNRGCNPLLLTPLIEEGKIKEARIKSEVKFNDFKAVKSYSGYFTVNKQFDSNLFFWFFPAETDYENSPVILWLQGGPGTTSLLGVFFEHGPFFVTSDLNILPRYHRWTKNHSVIYMDSPVGTGYSFTNADGFAKNESIIAKHLYDALQQFFKVFPELQKNAFFVAGESYGGKYVPAISYKIHVENKKANQKINLQGLAIGNGFSDPKHQILYSEYFFQNGLIDFKEKKQIRLLERKIVSLIKRKRWIDAFDEFCNLIYDVNSYSTLFKNVTGFNSSYNILQTNVDGFLSVFEYIVKEDVMTALHASPNHTFQANKVEEHLITDFMKSVAPWVEQLLNNYRVLIYHGQLDIIVTYAGTLNYLNHLNFTGKDDYKNATRQKWIVDNSLGGYIKIGGNLNEVLVRNAGHMAPHYQSALLYELITKFTRNSSFFQ